MGWNKMKEQERIKIDVEDLDAETAQAETETVNISDELRNLGKQFADTIQTAWNSDERVKLEAEIREGIKNFGEEINNVFSQAKESDAGQRIREEASKVDSSDAAQKVRSTLAQGIQWLSQELSKLSDSLATPEPKEKSPEDVE